MDTTQLSGKTISGNVLSVDGKPISSVTVYFETTEFPSEREFIQQTQSDSNGNFSMIVPDIAWRAGEIRISGMIFAAQPGIGFSAPAREKDSPVSLRLKGSLDLPLTFLGPDGNPVAGFHAWPYWIKFKESDLQMRPELGKQWGATTDSDGKCIIHGLPVGLGVVLASDDDRFAAMTYQDMVLLQMAAVKESQVVHLLPGATVTGRVINPETGNGVAGLDVFAQGTNNNPSGGGNSTTDEKGVFHLKGLRSGKYVVSISHMEQTAPNWTVVAAQIRLSDHEQAHIDLTLTHGGILQWLRARFQHG